MSKLIKCKGCEKEVFKNAKACPNCGKEPRNWFARNRINVALLVVSGLSIITVFDYKNLESEILSKTQSNSVSVVEQSESAQKTINEENVSEPPKDVLKTEPLEQENIKEDEKELASKKEEVVVEEKEKEVSVDALSSSQDELEKENKEYSFEEENALRNAQQHVSEYPFSYEQLIKKLISEDFPKETAMLVVDSLGVNWNEQAVLSAEFHLIEQGYSKKGLTKKLLTEGFIQKEIDYALVEVGY